jgi:hypothetical protein
MLHKFARVISGSLTVLVSFLFCHLTNKQQYTDGPDADAHSNAGQSRPVTRRQQQPMHSKKGETVLQRWLYVAWIEELIATGGD